MNKRTWTVTVHFTPDEVGRLMKKTNTKSFDSHGIPEYIHQQVIGTLGDNPNAEDRFIGATVSGQSLIDHHDTIVLGGSNYVFSLIGSEKVEADVRYKVVAFIHGTIYLKED